MVSFKVMSNFPNNFVARDFSHLSHVTNQNLPGSFFENLRGFQSDIPKKTK